MKILTLMENTCGAVPVTAEHGLSVYMETKKHTLLLDTGQSDATWTNAAVLGVDLSKIDTVIISHGHYDHAGGVMGFVEKNPDAAIYLQQSAAGQYYHDDRYIGMDSRIQTLPQVHFLKGNVVLDEELSLFTDITGRRLWPSGNRVLYEKQGETFVQDQFRHEQCLVIQEDGKYVLLSGCAHNGILNILDRFRELYHRDPDVVISGFHMKKNTLYTKQEIADIRATAEELKQMKTTFYSGHCTGQAAFDLMKEILGEQLIQMHAGEWIMQ